MGLSIGPLVVDPPVVLAPMAGVTNTAFRRLCRSYGGGLYVSEMVTARALVEGNRKTARMVARAEGEPVHSVQLYGVDPDVMGRAVAILVNDVGVDHVDLNFGCPVPKVTKLGGGAALPLHHNLFTAIVTAAVGAAGEVPVTVKMRVGVTDEHITYLRAARAAADAGVAAVALHARTAEQLYSGVADWRRIADLVAVLDGTGVPALGNGDIWEAHDARRMMEETGCAGVVVGRGCLGRPWLFRDLDLVLRGEPVPAAPTLAVVADAMRTHARLLVEDFADEASAVRDFRKHVAWYLTGYPVGGAVRRSMALASSLAELDAMLDALDGSLLPHPDAARAKRGHTHGPRPVSLPYGWIESAESTEVPAGAELLVSGG
ncbi:MAG TPA: tRNA dihydrouridine synthase DusB [Acidimicrobiales bacterium]|nr:tRNA dihydrouridine synthase DusB [Acidimicrobiales bacterium]